MCAFEGQKRDLGLDVVAIVGGQDLSAYGGKHLIGLRR